MANRFTIAFISLLLLAISAQGEEYGQNKVQYRKFDWQYLQSKHFDIYFTPDNKKIAEFSADWAESSYQVLTKRINHVLQKRIPVIIYGSHNQFEQTNVILEALPEGVGGFTEYYKNRVVVPFEGDYVEYRHVLRHELTHAMVFDMLYGSLAAMVMRSQFNMPLWFHEGLSEYQSLGWDLEADAYMIDMAANSALPSFEGDFGGFAVYKAGQLFYNYLAHVYGDEAIAKFLHRAHIMRDFGKAFESTFGIKLDEASKQWALFVKRSYWPEMGRRQPLDEIAEQLTNHEKDKSFFNLQPAISPNGDRVAFFSDRKDYTDIYVLDIKTKKIVSRIASQEQRSYIETFHPFRSGIAWSPDGTRLLLISRIQGKERLTIFDVKKKKKVDEIRIDLENVVFPDWSPDGGSVVFSASQQGASDLYLLKLSTRKIRRLTADRSCELHPRFSPDGAWIAFDSYSEADSLGVQTVGRQTTDIYMIRQDGSELRRLTSNPFDDRSPAWMPDGRNLIFTSNRNGLENLYVMDIDSSGRERPLTDAMGSCQTPHSARTNARVVFSYYSGGAWDIYSIANPLEKAKAAPLINTRFVESLMDTTKPFFPARRPVTAIAKPEEERIEKPRPPRRVFRGFGFTDLDTVEMPPPRRDTAVKRTEDSTLFFHDSLAYKNVRGAYKSYPYRLKFSPDVAAVGLVASTYYGGAAQGALVVSDILGNHRIGISGDFYQGSVGTSNLVVNYLYLPHRIDWGLVGFFSRNYTPDLIDGNGIADYLDQDFGGLIMAQYPFSVASRLELSVLGLSVERKGGIDDLGQLITDAEPVGFQSVVPQAALVTDNILWGFTGPVNGRRFRLDFSYSPPLGQDNPAYWSLTTDLRKYYHFAKQYSLALRFSAGRSDPLGGRQNPVTFKLGGDYNWIYDPKINPTNFDNTIEDTYFSSLVAPLRGTVYDEMAGTRFVLGNLEFRYPFIRNITFQWPIPLELRYINGALFMDMGGAWNRTADWHPFTTEGGWPALRDLDAGIGAGIRMNLGIAVLRIDRAWKTDFSKIKNATTYVSLGAEF